MTLVGVLGPPCTHQPIRACSVASRFGHTWQLPLCSSRGSVGAGAAGGFGPGKRRQAGGQGVNCMVGCLRQGENEKLTQLLSLAFRNCHGPNALPLAAAEGISGADCHLPALKPWHCHVGRTVSWSQAGLGAAPGSRESSAEGRGMLMC